MTTTEDLSPEQQGMHLIAQLMSASAADLAHTTNLIEAGLRREIQDWAKAYALLYQYVDKCEREGRAPRESVVAKYDHTYERALRTVETGVPS